MPFPWHDHADGHAMYRLNLHFTENNIRINAFKDTSSTNKNFLNVKRRKQSRVTTQSSM